MKKSILYISSLILLLSSCTKEIELDLESLVDQKLVVQGWITDQQMQHEVILTLTTDYFEPGATPRATGAIITIEDGTQTFNLTETEPGIYLTPEFAGEVGKTYTLTIDWSDEIYTASSTLREVAPIDNINLDYFDPLEEIGFEDDPYYSVRLFSQELEGLGDAYFWRIDINDEPIRDDLDELSFVEDSFYDGSPIINVEIDILYPEEDAVSGDTVLIEQWNIGFDAYEIINAIKIETDWRGGLFDSPPANVPTNISNGAVGFFGTAGVSTFEVIFP